MVKKDSHWHFHPAVRSGDERTLGERAADTMRHGMGSWPFVFSFVVLMTAWMLYNGYSHHPFDVYPFILLNLMLSTLAGLQGAILLIAAKRADRISAELAAYHLDVSEHANKELADLKEIIADIKHMMAELDMMNTPAIKATKKTKQ
jgi:uncharacterized membrane protein